jgi:preprotein translocase subunit SecF
MNLLGRRYWFFIISTLIILPGLFVMAIWKLPISIDFTGGSLLEAQFNGGNPPAPEALIGIYEQLGISDVQVQTSEDNIVIIRSPFLEESERVQVIDQIENEFGVEVKVRRFESVGPTIGQEVTNRAALAVAVAAFLVLIYIIISFRGVPNAFRYGVCAILAMLHDVAIIFSITAIGGRFFGWQVDALFLTALLTVIGFSMQDTIVVFDRIRENTNLHRRLPFETLVNHSIVQTLQRSINTQLMTVEFMLLALALFGGVTLQQFAIVLLVGLFSGTYSSIFISAPILVVWENREWRTWFSRRQPKPAS